MHTEDWRTEGWLREFWGAVRNRLWDIRMTQKELAGRIGATPQFVNKALLGQKPGFKYIGEVARTLGIDINFKAA